MEKVSVLMTVYNGENVLDETIQPILNQTYSNIEFVIVNDGSADRSSEIIQAYADQDPRIVFVNRSENKGRVYSLNEGLDACSGEYIAINDADDISTVTRIEEMMRFVHEKGIEKRFGVVGSSYITEDRVNGTKEGYVLKTGSFGSRVTRTRIFFGMPFIHSTFIYRKEALMSVGGFAREVTSSIDYFTLSKISTKYPIYANNIITVTRLVDGNNYFLKPEVLRKKKKNVEIIEAWEKENYRAYPVLNVIRKVKVGLQRKMHA